MPKNNNNKAKNKKIANGRKGPQPLKVLTDRSRKASDDVFSIPYKSTSIMNYPKGNGNPLLSKCAFKYALAIAEPFHPMAKSVCVPTYPSQPSFKHTAVARFNMAIGTAGVGFITCHPCLANDSPSAFFSTSTFTGAGALILTANNTVRAGVSSINANLPYATAQILPTNGAYQLAGRVVSYGVRLTYIGTTLNTSGSMYCYVSPTHDNTIPTAVDIGTLGAVLDCDVDGITRDPCSVSIFGTGYNETSYSNQPQLSQTQLLYPFCNAHQSFNGGFTIANSAGINLGSAPGVVLVTGVAGSQFLCELVVHTEYTGISAVALSTPSEADPDGFQLVQAAAQQIPLRKTTTERKSTFNHLIDGLKEVAVAIKPVAIDALVKAAGMMLI